MTSVNVLVLNCGSSSRQVPARRDRRASGRPRARTASLAKGLVENIGGRRAPEATRRAGRPPRQGDGGDPRAQDRGGARARPPDPRRTSGWSRTASEIDAVGHRVVHGGERFKASVRIDDAVLAGHRGLLRPGAAAQPAQREGLPRRARAARRRGPAGGRLRHRLPPDDAADAPTSTALPYVLYERHGIRRYGFHGTSHRFVVAAAGRAARPPGSTTPACASSPATSATAARWRPSAAAARVDTSMGFTPLEGSSWARRSGDLDPAILLARDAQGGAAAAGR